ncbi:MAG TPA: glycosyltransferase [Candidatus Omnitrophota bacterium]|nr:glycosyltransferase [Candidatus Omnitrophota bacterium]
MVNELKKPRVLLLVGWYFPDYVGGTEMYVRYLARDLVSKGWDVTVGCPSPDSREERYVFDGVPVYRFPITNNPTRAELRSEESPVYFDVFSRWLQEYNPDIVHMHSLTRGCGFSHAQLIKRLGLPLVLTIHAADFLCVGGTSMRWGEIPCDGRTHAVRCTSCWVRNIGGSWLVAWILARLPASLSVIGKHFHNKLGTALSLQQLFQGRERQIQWMLQNSDQIVAVSKWLYYVLHLNGVAHEKITLCRHGLPEELIPVVHPESKPTSDVLRIGFIGRFSYVKGVHLLITAMKRLPRSMRVELKLFGRANTLEEKKYLAKLMKMSASESRIVFCGELTKENKKKVFESIDILAVPSIWFETGPLVVLEAFAAGIPVIGSNLGGIAELVTDGENGILVSVGDVKAWETSIRWILSNREILLEWKRKIPPVRSSREVSLQMMALYHRLIEHHKLQKSADKKAHV